MSALADLFPEGDYRFHLTLRKVEPGDYFRTGDVTGRTLAERRHWLAADPTRYAAMSPEAESLLAEFEGLCEAWGLLQRRSSRSSHKTGAMIGEADSVGAVRALGEALEPDILFLSSDAAGAFRLNGGVLCFPTGWALRDKLGQTLDEIHGVVPGLNAAIGSSIKQFLSRLKPGVAYLRDNWGLAATAELNLHPSLGRPAPQPPVALDRLWLRVEHQALLALPQTGGIVFGIRIGLHRLDEVVRDAHAVAGLRRALETMPADLAAYKRMESTRQQLLALIQ